MSRRGAAGFTLLEIIVAFAILALGLTYLLGTLSGASRQLRQGGDAGRAALHAQSVLDQYAGTLSKPAFADGVLDEGRYRWRMEALPWKDPQAAAGQPVDPNGARLLRVEVEVSWGERGPREQLKVSSLRLVLPRQDGAKVLE